MDNRNLLAQEPDLIRVDRHGALCKYSGVDVLQARGRFFPAFPPLARDIGEVDVEVWGDIIAA